MSARGVCAGARIASLVVSKPELFQEWNEEMEYMSGRIKVGLPASLTSGFRVRGVGLGGTAQLVACGPHAGYKHEQVISLATIDWPCLSCSILRA